MSFSKAVVIRENKESDGSIQQHNFHNKYVAADELKKPSKELAAQITQHTQEKLQKILWEKASTIQGTAQSITNSSSQIIKYTPQQQGLHNSGANARMIKMQTVQSDPIAPTGFKHKKIPQGPGSPPAPLMHSPPRKLTLQDQLDWKIPPCISNWKNAKGYTLPLEYRIAADGRCLQTYSINDKFAQVADAYYLAERQARAEIEERNLVGKSLAYKEYLKKEDEMRKAAARAREDKQRVLEEVQLAEREDEDQEYQQRQEILYMRKRELESEQRLEYAGKNKAKAVRDKERDVSEKIALGQAQASKLTNEALFDQRLFNQNSGLNSGFGEDDDYNVYSKPLFQDRTAANIYNNIRNVPDDDDEVQKVDTLLNKAPTKTFEGALQTRQGRNRPVEFERNDDSIFGMDQFVEKKVKK